MLPSERGHFRPRSESAVKILLTIKLFSDFPTVLTGGNFLIFAPLSSGMMGKALRKADNTSKFFSLYGFRKEAEMSTEMAEVDYIQELANHQDEVMEKLDELEKKIDLVMNEYLGRVEALTNEALTKDFDL